MIDANRNQIRFCYERELQRHQELQGRVTMKWLIGATGAVAAVMVTESTMKNVEVESCMIEQIKTWKFPAPAGGGIVTVNYPFILTVS